jgi:hypothetical protein
MHFLCLFCYDYSAMQNVAEEKPEVAMETPRKRHRIVLLGKVSGLLGLV